MRGSFFVSYFNFFLIFLFSFCLFDSFVAICNSLLYVSHISYIEFFWFNFYSCFNLNILHHCEKIKLFFQPLFFHIHILYQHLTNPYTYFHISMRLCICKHIANTNCNCISATLLHSQNAEEL